MIDLAKRQRIRSNPPKGLVGYWRFGANGQIMNMIGKNPGAQTGGTATAAPSGPALFMNNTTDYINLGSGFNFERTQPHTIAVQIRNTVTNDCCITTSQLNDGLQYLGYGLGVHSGTGRIMAFLYGYTSGLIVNWPSAYTDGQFHNLTYTYNGNSTATGLTLYTDGAAVNKGTIMNNLSTSIVGGANFQINGRGGANALWSGIISYLQIYNRELTAKEVANIHYDPDYMAASQGKLAGFALKLLALAECISTPTADSLALQPCNLLSLGLTESTPIADAVALTETLSLLLDTAESTPTASPFALANATALICLDAISTPTSDALTLANAVLLVIESTISIPQAMPLTLSGQIALTLSQAISTPTADDVIIRSDLALQLEQAISMGRADSLALEPWQTLTVPDAVSTPRALSLALTDILIGLGKLFNPQPAVATPLHSLASATSIHSIRKVDG